MLSAEYVQTFLELSAGIRVSLEEAQALVPLVASQRSAFCRFDRFDLSAVRLPVSYDPRAPYRDA